MTTQEFLYCLAMTESRDRNIVSFSGEHYVLMGDAGRALGRWQTHPDWVHTQEIRFGLQPALNETWDSFIGRLVTAFFDHYIQSMTEQEVAMYFHLGHRTLPTDADWDAAYAQRFQGFAAEFTRGA